jgi:putative transposase
MKRGRFRKERIVGILKEHKAGRKVAELSRGGQRVRRCMAGRNKHGGMGLGEAQRERSLEDENRGLKEWVADLSLDKEAVQGDRAKKGWSLPA